MGFQSGFLGFIMENGIYKFLIKSRKALNDKEYGLALQYSNIAIESAENDNDCRKNTKIDILRQISLIYYKTEEYTEYINIQKKILSLLKGETGNDNKEYARHNYLIALAYINLKDYLSSIDYLYEAEKTLNKLYLQDDALYMDILSNLGYSFFCENEYKHAILYLKESIRLRKSAYREHIDYNCLIRDYFFLSQSYKKNDNFSRYIINIQKHIKLFQELYGINNQYIMKLNFDIGIDCNIFGSYSKAIAFLNKAFKIAETICDIRDKIKTQIKFNIGISWFLAGEYQKAIKEFKMSLEIGIQSGLKEDELIDNIVYLSMSYLAGGKHDSAIFYLEDLLKNTRISGFDAFNIYSTLAEAYYYNNDYENAIINYHNIEKYLNNNKDISPYHIAEILLNQCLCYNSLEQYGNEILYYEKLIKFHKEFECLDIEIKNLIYNNLIIAVINISGDIFAKDYHDKAFEMIAGIIGKDSKRLEELKDLSKILRKIYNPPDINLPSLYN